MCIYIYTYIYIHTYTHMFKMIEHLNPGSGSLEFRTFSLSIEFLWYPRPIATSPTEKNVVSTGFALVLGPELESLKRWSGRLRCLRGVVMVSTHGGDARGYPFIKLDGLFHGKSLYKSNG